MQALLLERRIVMVAQDRDTLSASLHAAAALLYPFRWHHIYLPFLPHNLKVQIADQGQLLDTAYMTRTSGEPRIHKHLICEANFASSRIGKP